MKNKLYALTAATLIVAIGVLAVLPDSQTTEFSSTTVKRRPLVVANKALDANTNLILIGIDASESLSGSVSVDVEAQGFKFEPRNNFKGQAPSLKKVDPRFLITKDQNGVQAIYGFNVKRISADDRNGSALPPGILDLAKFKKQTLLQDPIATATWLTGFFVKYMPYTIGKDVWNIFFRGREKERQTESAYLIELIEQELIDGDHPTLSAYFETCELADLGQWLSIRFNRWGALRAFLEKPNQTCEYFMSGMGRRRDQSRVRFTNLASIAESQRLLIEPVGDHFALIKYSRSLAERGVYDNFKAEGTVSGISPADFEKKITQMDQELSQKYPDTNLLSFLREAGTAYVPMAIVALNTDGKLHVQALNFQNTNQQRRRALLRRLMIMAESVQALIGPGIGISFALNAANDLFRHQAAGRKSDFFVIEKRQTLLGTLRAYMEAAEVFDWSEIDLHPIKDLLRASEFPPDKKDQLARAISGSDARAKNLAISEILVYETYAQSGTLLGQGGGSEGARWNVTRQTHFSRLGNWLKDRAKISKYAENLQKTSRQRSVQPAVAPAVENPGGARGNLDDISKQASRPVIFFGVDALKSIRLKKLAEQPDSAQIIPNMKARFIDSGVEIESFVSNAVTLTSWSTIFTGTESDRHGLKASTWVSRNPEFKKFQNLIDPRHDLEGNFLPIAKPESRGKIQLNEAGVNWLPGYLNPLTVLTNLMPIRDKKFIPIMDTAGAAGALGIGILSHDVDPTFLIDEGQAAWTARLIEEDAKRPDPQLKLIMNWYTSIDHVGHQFNSQYIDSVKAVDRSIGRVLKAASNHPYLKNAVVIMASDHGISGGFEYGESDNEYFKSPQFEKYRLKNQTFNLHRYLGGHFDNPKYNFVVTSTGPSESREFPSEKAWQKPASFINFVRTFIPRGTYGQEPKVASQTPQNAIVERYGDSYAQVIFRSKKGEDPKIGKSFYQLTHFEVVDDKGVKSQLNIVEDLLNYQLLNKSPGNEPSVIAEIEKYSNFRPVSQFVMPIQKIKGTEHTQLAQMVGLGAEKIRDPVLVRAYGGKTGLIFSRDIYKDNKIVETRTKYFVVRGFEQKVDGDFVGTVTDDPNFDPFNYRILNARGEVKTFPTDAWLSDKEVLAKFSANDKVRKMKESYPTAIFSLARHFTFSPDLEAFNPKVTDELKERLPDFAIYSHIGFSFNPWEGHEADHGNLHRESVRSSLYVSDDMMSLSHGVIDSASALSRDITPTILDYLGLEKEISKTEGESFRKIIEDYRVTTP